jgi:hypothetical protein
MNLLTDVAITFNDNSILENFHISEGFKTLLKPENNFLSNLSNLEAFIFNNVSYYT